MRTLKYLLLLTIVAATVACTKGISTGPDGISESNLKEQWTQKKKEFDQQPMIEEDEIFVVVEQMPKIKGGIQALVSLIKYPDEARANNIEGRVFVQFVVDKSGQVRDPKLIKGIGHGCDEAALLAVSELEFEPGEQRDQKVAVRYSLPIVFKLQGEQHSTISSDES